MFDFKSAMRFILIKNSTHDFGFITIQKKSLLMKKVILNIQ